MDRAATLERETFYSQRTLSLRYCGSYEKFYGIFSLVNFKRNRHFSLKKFYIRPIAAKMLGEKKNFKLRTSPWEFLATLSEVSAVDVEKVKVAGFSIQFTSLRLSVRIVICLFVSLLLKPNSLSHESVVSRVAK